MRSRLKVLALTLVLCLATAASIFYTRSLAAPNVVVSATRSVKVGNRSLTAQVVTCDLSEPSVRVEVALGQDRVGGTEDLLGLALRKGAIAAVNGAFFNAYVDGQYKDPVGTLITRGEMVHRGATGTVFGITAGREVRMEPVRFKVIGATNGSYKWPNNWYSYWINRTPTSANFAGIFTPARGVRTGAVGGTSVVVRNGVVTKIAGGEQEIPGDGYVINFQGSETSLLSRFTPGVAVDYQVVLDDDAPLTGFWADVREGLGAGPKLVEAGQVVYSSERAKSEGFTDSKILVQSSARSALGLSGDGKLLLVTVGSATMDELALVMLELGAVEAMNLDGGASSGLVYNGRYLTKTGRAISNALLIHVGGN